MVGTKYLLPKTKHHFTFGSRNDIQANYQVKLEDKQLLRIEEKASFGQYSGKYHFLHYKCTT